MKSQKVTFRKSQKLFKNSTKDRLFTTCNSYSFNIKGGLCNYRKSLLYRALWLGGEQFL